MVSNVLGMAEREGAKMKPKQPRAEHCAYLTPENVYSALWKWWDSQQHMPDPGSLRWLDPACGDGRLLHKPYCDGAQVFGFDIRPECEKSFNNIGKHFVLVDDSLQMKWPENTEIIMNPPFGTRSNDLAGKFMRKMISHCTVNRRWGVALQLSSVLQAKRRGDIRLPDYKLDLTWRPQFERTKAMSGGYFKDFSWFVYSPTPTGTCKTYRLRKDGHGIEQNTGDT